MRRGKNWLGQRGKAVTQSRKKFAVAEPIGKRSGEYLRDGSRRFGDTFDDADSDDRTGARRSACFPDHAPVQGRR